MLKTKNTTMKKRTLYIFGLIAIAIVIVFDQFFVRKSTSESYLNKVKDSKGNLLPRGWRNNNAGNIKYSPTNLWLGKIPYLQNKDANRTFEQFSEFRYGVRAMIILLRNQINRNKTLGEIIVSYAPPIENNTEVYLSTIERMVGIKRTQRLAPTKPNLKRLVLAISVMENGAKWAISEAQFEEGYSLVS